MQSLLAISESINAVMLGKPTLFALLGVGVLFTLWTGLVQYRSLTHGFSLISGRVPAVSAGGSGALSHFQALSAALSGTVGLGNIGGVAIAVSIGGPGAVFWMWVVGLVGMALKFAEVSLAMIYRDTSNPELPRGGTMWVAKKGLATLPFIGSTAATLIGAVFAIALVAFGITGGNMFQAWNVADITHAYFGVNTQVTGGILAVLVGLVVLGGIRRIGQIAGTLVPLMCGLYMLGSFFVLVVNAERLPEVFGLIFRSAFGSAEASGAFTGAAFGTAFIFGMKRALFSSESGLGSAPIAHAAVKTREPMSEGIVAGLEPFIDTLVVCTLTALVILSSGVWERGPIASWTSAQAMVKTADGGWQPAETTLPTQVHAEDKLFRAGEQVFTVVEVDGERSRLYGQLELSDSGLDIRWRPLSSVTTPVMPAPDLYADYPASTLTAKAFDSAQPGLGRWMVVVVVWLFAVSTMITWCYYGEQGVIYLLGERAVLPFRLLWCAAIFAACLGWIRTDAEIDTLSTVALGLMLAVNLPTMILLGPKVIAAYRGYLQRLENGTLGQG